MTSGRVRVSALRAGDLDQVIEIERASFESPWNRQQFLREMRENRHGWNLAPREADQVVAYASAILVGEELEINNLAVHPSRRREGHARRLLMEILAQAPREGAFRASLEVAVSNVAARALYVEFGFREVGRRRGY